MQRCLSFYTIQTVIDAHRLAYCKYQFSLHRSFANQDSEELTTQITVLREKERVALARSHELQHMLLDVESKLETMKEQTQETTSKVSCRVTHITGILRMV